MTKRMGGFLNVALLALCSMAAPVGLTGCGTLDKTGAYGGDKFLYDADLAIASSYEVLHSFVKFEHDNRASLAGTPEVAKYADVIRKGAPQWFGSAIALRDAYKGNPNAGTKSALQTALDVLREAVNQATRYMAQPTSSANPSFSPVPPATSSLRPDIGSGRWLMETAAWRRQGRFVVWRHPGGVQGAWV